MDYSSYSKFKLGTLILAMVAVSACSSSKVEDGQGTPPEMVSDLQGASPEASTDAVPAPDAAKPADAATQPAPDALDASALDAPQDTSAGAAAPGAVVDAPPAVAEAPTAGAADSDPLAATAAPAPSDIPAAPVTEAPVADAPAPGSEPMVVVDNSANPEVPIVSPHAHKKGKKHKHSTVAAAAVPSGDGVHYQVKQGDTLMKIAFENYGDLYRWKEVYEANRANIPDPSHVAPGTQLTLNGAGMVTVERNGDRYMIKHGDTLGTISHDVYGNARQWKKLWENNRQLIKDPNKIYAGFYLYYQPEGRLSHDQKQEVVPSASTTTAAPSGTSVTPTQSLAPPPTKFVQNSGQPAVVTPTTPTTANTAPANTGARAPASVK